MTSAATHSPTQEMRSCKRLYLSSLLTMSSDYNTWAPSDALSVDLFPAQRWHGFFFKQPLCAWQGVSRDGGPEWARMAAGKILSLSLALSISIILSWAHPQHVRGLLQTSGEGSDCSSLTCAHAQAVCLEAGLGLQHFCGTPCRGNTQEFPMSQRQEAKSKMWGGDSTGKGDCSPPCKAFD